MDPFIGQIQTFGFNFAPRSWALCNGQLLAISSNTALFSLLGVTYGGDGRTTFALPDLRGRSIVHVGSGLGLSNISWGQKGGVEQITLSQTNLPSHSHLLQLPNSQVTINTIDNENVTNESEDTFLGTGGTMPEIYREAGSGTEVPLSGVSLSGSTTDIGGNIPFNNRNPYLGMYVCIALFGVFPSRS